MARACAFVVVLLAELLVPVVTWPTTNCVKNGTYLASLYHEGRSSLQYGSGGLEVCDGCVQEGDASGRWLCMAQPLCDARYALPQQRRARACPARAVQGAATWDTLWHYCA